MISSLAELSRQSAQGVPVPSSCLVLSGTMPGADGVGALLLRQIYQAVPDVQFVYAHMVHADEQRANASAENRTELLLSRQHEAAWRPLPGAAGAALSWMADRTVGVSQRRRVIKRSVQFGRDRRVCGVLAVLESPQVIRVARTISKRLRVPLWSFVMDAPAALLSQYCYCRPVAKSVLAEFDRCLRSSRGIAVAGESMKVSYERRYGTPCSVLRQGVPEAVAPSADVNAKCDQAIRIGFAGSLTAPDAFSSLLEALDRCGWQVCGRPVVVMVVGAHVKLIPSGPQRIEYYGWQQWPELLSLLSRCDFLYLPQPFYEGARQVAEFSFPNKICTYVPVGKPILLHGPEYGSLVSFFERFPCGPVCSKLPAAELLAQVERAVNDPSLYQSYVTNAMRAYEEELNAQTLESNVRMFLSSFGSAT